MTERSKVAAYCVHGDCKHPRIRKGEAVILTTFANYDGLNGAGEATFTPWLGAVRHLRHKGGLDEPAIRAAIAAKRLPRSGLRTEVAGK